MAVMSFAHLKPSNQQPASPDRDSKPMPSSKKGVVSFAHLKPTNKQPAPADHPIQVLHIASCIGIAKTALLASANYCRSCPRFWPADENERKNGVVYGRCMRSDTDGVEVWRIIPPRAKVYQCHYHQGTEDRDIHGPAPCQIKNWKLEM